jgi:hypothetical protein
MGITITNKDISGLNWFNSTTIYSSAKELNTMYLCVSDIDLSIIFELEFNTFPIVLYCFYFIAVCTKDLQVDLTSIAESDNVTCKKKIMSQPQRPRNGMQIIYINGIFGMLAKSINF